jgi:RNA polymerase sigma-70 factor (ECF subfamily)
MAFGSSEHLAADVRRCAEQLSQGSDGALDELYELSAARLVRYAFSITQHLDDAEDAFQSAIVRVARRPYRLAQAHNPWAYFLRMVRNEAVRLLQRRRPIALPELHPVADYRAAATLDAEDLKRSVRIALQQLPPNQAEVVVLKVWEGMTFAEIASVLDESPNTVASRYRYALQKLGGLLGRVADEVAHDG